MRCAIGLALGAAGGPPCVRLSSLSLCIAVSAFAVAICACRESRGAAHVCRRPMDWRPERPTFERAPLRSPVARSARGRSACSRNPGGEVVVSRFRWLSGSRHHRRVSMRFIAPSGIYAGIGVSGFDGVTVNAPGAIVVLRGLSINGQGGNRGIFLHVGCTRAYRELCRAQVWASRASRDNAAGAEMIVLDTIVRDNLGSGVAVVGDLVYAVLDHVRSEHNGGDGFSFAPISGSIGAHCGGRRQRLHAQTTARGSVPLR